MRSSIHRPRATRLRVAVAGLTGSALIAAAFTGATAPASAAGLNLVASSTSIAGALTEDGSALALTLTVAPSLKLPNLNLGVGLAPTGTVTLTDDKGDYLGAWPLPKCLLTICTVNGYLSVAPISDGVTYITATYPGDLLLKPSVGYFRISKSSCTGDNDCDAFTTDGPTELDVSADDTDSSDAYVEANLGGPALPCSVGGPEVANFNGHNLSGRKTITYDVDGPAATNYVNLDNGFFDGDDGSWMCWVSPNPFNGFSHDGATTFPHDQSSYNSFGPAPQLTSGPYAGDYVALLDWCSDLDSSDSSPCLEYYDFGDFEETGLGVHVEVSAPAGDPHAGG